MNTMTKISLSDNWQIAYFSKHRMNRGWSRGFSPLGSISDWTNTSPVDDFGVLFFRMFFLEPADGCVRYVLHVDTAPENTRLDFNGRHVADIVGTPIGSFNVTDDVQLERNIITFEVDGSATGKFGAVYLEQVPCE